MHRFSLVSFEVPLRVWRGTIYKMMTKELLTKFLNNNCSKNELEQVIAWVKSEGAVKHGKYLSIKEWQAYNPEEDSEDTNFDSLLDKIHHKINVQNPALNQQKSRFAKGMHWFSRAAAILIIPILGILAYTVHQPFQIAQTISHNKIDSVVVIAPIGSKTMVQLEDGTVVHLNHGSKLKYPQKFIGKTREVELTGEAYFDVSHNPKKPFVVNTDKLVVEAVGTSFNVMAYPKCKTIETTLVEGKVNIHKQNVSSSNASINMVPGQHVKYNARTGKARTLMVNTEKYTAWKDGRLILQNDPIAEIAKKLSRWYNVEISFADSGVKNYTYTGTFVDETLHQILDLMVLATPISYTIKERKKLPNGTYSRQHIVIGSKK